MDVDAPPAATTAAPRGFLSVLGDLYLAPGQAFHEIARHPAVWTPLFLLVLLQVAFIGVWLSQMDILEFLRSQAEQNGRPMPPVTSGSKIVLVMQVSMGLSAVIVPVLGVVTLAGLLLLVYNFVLGSSGTYRQYLSVLTWSLVASSLVTTPLVLLTMALKGDWNVAPDTVLATNLGAFLDPGQVPRWLLALAKRIDIVVLWLLFLISTGLGCVTRRSTGSAAAPLVGLWLVAVGVAVLFSSVF